MLTMTLTSKINRGDLHLVLHMYAKFNLDKKNVSVCIIFKR